ncbi:MAG: glycosyltransferase family 2 protein [Nitrospirota bacterium]|nr:MAG: glycosyltransferase family 2 protein [Nitrospirota bacterium]
MDGVTIFFPAYNEEMYVKRAVEAAREVVDLMLKEGEISDYEIIIINDASTDNTATVADEIASKDERIKVIHHQENKGLGGAMRTGFANASKEVILYSDIDLPFDMMELRKAYRFMRYYEADIVSAFRYDRTGEGLRRLIYSKCYNALIMALFRLRVKDVNFAFKLVRREIFDHIELRSDGSFIDAELMIKADRLGMRIIQFGTNYFHRSRGVSTLSSWSVIFKILREMSTLYSELRSIKTVK